MKTYAQNFEDVILERLFPGENDGFYVDVGAWDPTYHSVTAHFYKKGWRGINIEPIEERVAAFDRERPRDINLPVAISSQEKSVKLWLCDRRSYLSTTNSDQAAELHASGSGLTERLVPSRSLNSILGEYAPPEITFLKIDVEGSEADVLATLDLARWRPRVILIEATEPAAPPSDWDHAEERATWSRWEPDLLKAGYVFGYFDGLNRFYLRVEDQHLIGQFRLPPGVFDRIENLNESDVLARLEACENDRAEGLERIERLGTKLQSAREQLKSCEKERKKANRALNEKQAHLRAKHDAKDHQQRRWISAVRRRVRSLVAKFGRRSGVEP